MQKNRRVFILIKVIFLSLRFKGIYEDWVMDYDKRLAIIFHHECARSCKLRNKNPRLVISLSFMLISAAPKSKEFYFTECSLQKKEEVYLHWWCLYQLRRIYKRASTIRQCHILTEQSNCLGQPYAPRIDLSSTYNELGNTFFHEKIWSSMSYFIELYILFKGELNDDQQPLDGSLKYLRIYIDKHNFDSGQLLIPIWPINWLIIFLLKQAGRQLWPWLATCQIHRRLQIAYEYQEKWYALYTHRLLMDSVQTASPLIMNVSMAKQREQKIPLHEKRKVETKQFKIGHHYWLLPWPL